MTIGKRLKEERERLGLSQPRLGEIARVVKQTVIQWEKDASAPDAGQLAELATVGADVMYILTGKRFMHAAEPAAEYKPILSPDEAALLDNYRNSPQEGKQQLEASSALYAQLASKKKRA